MDPVHDGAAATRRAVKMLQKERGQSSGKVWIAARYVFRVTLQGRGLLENLHEMHVFMEKKDWADEADLDRAQTDTSSN
jgi:hypothetical protein